MNASLQNIKTLERFCCLLYVSIVTSLSILFDPATPPPIRMSATSAHISLSGPVVVYLFSHIIWIASFLAFRSSRFIPPSLAGVLIVFRFIEAQFPSHTRTLIIFCSLASILAGIPWTVARYCVISLANILTISLLDMRVGCLQPHLSKVACILSRLLDHTASLLIPLPIQPASICMGYLLFAMWMLLLKCALPGVVLQVVRSSVLYCTVPMCMISVLLTLNLAPDAQHHSSRRDRSSL
jgi:hypothetical protein